MSELPSRRDLSIKVVNQIQNNTEKSFPDLVVYVMGRLNPLYDELDRRQRIIDEFIHNENRGETLEWPT